MRIEVDRLSERGEAFAHTYAPDELTLDEEGVSLTTSVSVEGRAARKGSEVRLRGRIGTTVEVACDRCLRPVPFSVEEDFNARLEPAEMETENEELAELQPEDLDVSVYEGDSVDVDELVREQILLALPTRLHCREDCKGLCPTCGADLNETTCACEQKEIDPRWAGLAALKDRES
ncbi:MAG TPA: DUF177 domain-containing protein [Pyrinomonadaceae bacterium]|jgi:uncharacterized protein